MSHRWLWVVFWLLLIVFMAFFILTFTGVGLPYGVGTVLKINYSIWGLLALLGLVLLVLSIRSRLEKRLKSFLILTGASAAGLIASLLLHNLVFGLFMRLFGENFWDRFGGDEPLFFVLAVLLFPLAYLVGVVGSLILRLRKTSA